MPKLLLHLNLSEMTGMNRHTCHVSLNSVSQTFLHTNTLNLTHSVQQPKGKWINK